MQVYANAAGWERNVLGSATPGGLAEWQAHWRVVIPAFVGIMLCSAHAYTLGVMIGPLEQEFGWPRAQIAGGLLIVAVLALVIAPLMGSAVDRIGARPIALAGVALYSAALASLSLAGGNVLSWWALWIFLALAGVMIMPVVWLAVINGYFFASRGLAMAVALAGTGMGAAVLPMLTNSLLEVFGWRGAYLSLGVISAAICLPLTYFLFHPVRGKPAGAYSANQADGQNAASMPAPAPTARIQMTSPRFLKLGAAAIIFAVGISALTANLVPVLIAEGLTPARAAAIAGLLGIGSLCGRLIGGYLLDRFDGNKVAAVSVLLPIAPALILLGSDQSEAWAAVACLIVGLSVGAEVDACAYLAARHFGTRNFGALFGTINGMLLFGTGLAPLLANFVYDFSGSYDPVLVGLIPVLIVTAALFLSLGSYRHLDAETGLPMAQLQPAE